MKNEVNNYPIKYAMMKVYEQTEKDSLGYRGEKAVYYIVSKCYLIREIKTYSHDGNYNTKYEVVFPYTSLRTEHKRQYPEYNYYGECYNTTIVEEVYDLENKDILNKLVTNKNMQEYYKNTMFVDDEAAYQKEFAALSKECIELQLNIDEETKYDMPIKRSKIRTR